MTDEKPEVVVVGGGLAGLAAAAYVARAGRRVTVIESRDRLGGRATTDRRDGFWLNQGPHALYRGGPAEAALLELGVPISGGAPATRGLVVFDDRTHVAPATAATLVRTGALSWREKSEVARFLARLAKIDATTWADRSVTTWIDSSMRGERSRQLLHALVRLATYVNEPNLLSAQVAIGQLQAALASGVRYLDRGWQTLVDALAKTPGVRIEAGETLTTLPDAPAVIIATGTPRSAGALLDRTFNVGPSADATCLDLGVRRAPPHDFVLGGDIPFYFSNHSAVADLAPTNMYHVAAAKYLGAADAPDESGVQAFVSLAGISEDDIVMQRCLHRMKAVSAIAVAANGGLAGRPTVGDTGHANVFLAGDWVGPVGHLADATLASAKAAAFAALGCLERHRAPA